MYRTPAFLQKPLKASTIIGTCVVNSKGESLGDIKEVVIDPTNGNVAYIVVSFGGFMRLGEKLFAIPFTAFEYNAAGNEYLLDISKERLAAASGFDSNHWPAIADGDWDRDIHSSHFQQIVSGSTWFGQE